jgi:hypothetical protein
MHRRAPGDEEAYRICVGDDDSTRYYLDRFENFDLGGGPVSWSWPAFWATLLWLIHRRMYGYAAAYTIALPLLLFGFAWAMTQALGESAGKFFESGAAAVTLWVLVPMFANAAYHKHVTARIEKAQATTSSREEMLETLSRQRPTTHPSIMLLIFGVFLGGALAVGLAIRPFDSSNIRKQVAEGIELAMPVKDAVVRAYGSSGTLPTDLAAAGLNGADYQGKYVTAIDVIDGMVLIHYGNEANIRIAKSSLSLRPTVLDDGRLLWSCGYFQTSERDSVYGTNIDAEYLPNPCRATSSR